jgi:hypothetical protein
MKKWQNSIVRWGSVAYRDWPGLFSFGISEYKKRPAKNALSGGIV